MWRAIGKTTQHEKHTEKEEQFEATIPMVVNGI